MGERTAVRPARTVADELLAALAAERAAQARQLALVCELAEAYTSVVPLLDAPGGPRLVQAGADGTPDITDLFAVELGALLGQSTATAWCLLRDALNLRDRHPRVWAAVQAARVPAWQARHVARACAHLPQEAAADIDARIAPSLSRLPWARARRRLTGLIVTADPETAADRLARNRSKRFLRIDHTADGTSWLVGRLSTPDAVALDDAVRAIARSLTDDPGYPGTPDTARADALGVLATPAGPGRPGRPRTPR